MFKKALSFIIAATALSSCVIPDGPQTYSSTSSSSRGGPQTSERLLDAEGAWSVVEEESNYSPELLHEQAKKQVNPNDLRKKTHVANAYKPGQSGDLDTNFRLLRLENDRGAIGSIFSAKSPEPEVSSLAASNVKPAATPSLKPQVKPQVNPQVKSQEKQPAKKAAGGLQVTGLRTGEHPGKTRIVLDVTNASRYSYALERGNNVLLVEIEGAGWSAPSSKRFNHPLIESYSVKGNGKGGSIVELAFKKPAKVVFNQALKPNSLGASHRIFLDVAAL